MCVGPWGLGRGDTMEGISVKCEYNHCYNNIITVLVMGFQRCTTKIFIFLKKKHCGLTYKSILIVTSGYILCENEYDKKLHTHTTGTRSHINTVGSIIIGEILD